MKIEFLTQEDSLYILPFFEEFLSNYAGQFEITRISCCRAMGKRSRWQLLRELMWLYGTFGLMKLVAQAGVGEGACWTAAQPVSQRSFIPLRSWPGLMEFRMKPLPIQMMRAL